jgi:hypothetical protein
MFDRARSATVALVTIALLLVFPVTVTVLQQLQSPGYSPIGMAMSELALGTAGGAMTIAFCSMGVGTILVALLIRTRHPRARVAPAVLVVAGVLDIVSAFFHTNGQDEPDTTASTIHMIAGISTFLLVIVAMFASVRPFVRSHDWRRFGRLTLAWAILAFAAFFLVPVLGDDRFGLAQRLFVGVWLTWLIAVAVKARMTAPTRETTPTPQLAEAGSQQPLPGAP